jgi:hypothetical protein
VVAKSKPINGDNLQHLRRETSKIFRNKKRETNYKNKNIRVVKRPGCEADNSPPSIAEVKE